MEDPNNFKISCANSLRFTYRIQFSIVSTTWKMWLKPAASKKSQRESSPKGQLPGALKTSTITGFSEQCLLLVLMDSEIYTPTAQAILLRKRGSFTEVSHFLFLLSWIWFPFDC